MFGTWISDVQRALSAVFSADRSYDAEDLKSPQMPTAVGHFLSHALKRRAAHIEFSVESEWFDPEAPEVRSALESYRKALTSTARYPQSSWESSLDRAVQFVTVYLANPAVGLVNFVFGDSTELVPIARIKERLEYFGTHPALRKAILVYLDRKELQEMGPDDLRALVLKADRSLVKDFQPDDWVDHLEPLFELAAVLPKEENEEVELPTEVLLSFFGAKDSDEIVRRLEAIESVKGAHGLDAEMLRKLVGEQATPIVEEPEPEVQKQPAVRVPATRVVRNDMHREARPSVVPRWMQFAAGSASDGKAMSPNAVVPQSLSVDDPADTLDDHVPGGTSTDGAAKIGQRAPVPDDLGIVATGDGMDTSETETVAQSGESVPRWTKFQGAVNHSPVSPNAAPELEQVESRVIGHLNAVQRAWFINHLFGSDRGHWKTVMELLAKAADWNEASEIIATEVFDRHGVDIYSRPAVDFTNAVEARFR